MKRELPKVYEPQEVEGKIYQTWLDAGCSTWATPWTTPSRIC